MRLATLLGGICSSIRSLRRNPTFTMTVVLTLAIGIGANVAVFSLFHQILLRPLPVSDPERLVNLSDPGPELPGPAGMRGSPAGGRDSVFSYPMFRDLERLQPDAFVGIAAHRSFDANLSNGEQARRGTGMYVSGAYFSTLGLQASVGRLLGPQDDRIDGQADAAVLSYAYWQREYGADREILGRELIVNGRPLTIVGVAPPGFHGTTVGTRASVFVPISFPGLGTTGALPVHDDRRVYWVHLFARLRPDVTPEHASAAVNVTFHAILEAIEAPLATDADPQELQAFHDKSLVLESGSHGQSSLLGSIGPRLAMLLAVSGTLLALICANLAGLVLIRGSSRGGELAVRAALGATPGRLTAMLLIESALLALPAALLSLPIGLLTMRVLASGIPGVPAAAFDVRLSAPTGFVTFGFAVLSLLLFGLAPMAYVARRSLAKVFSLGTRHTSGKALARFRKTLATFQVALSMGLLSVTGIFVQSMSNIAQVELGFEPRSLALFSISPQAGGYSLDESEQVLRRLEQELAAIPGVTAVGSAMIPLLAGGGFSLSGFEVEGVKAEQAVSFNAVNHEFFETLGVELLAGRYFRESDGEGARVAIVNQRFADRFGLDDAAVGSYITQPIGGSDSVLTREIIGLVSNVKSNEITADAVPQLFVPRQQSPVPIGSATFYVRGNRQPTDLMASIRETAARVDPIIPITGLRTMDQQIGQSLSTERFLTRTSIAFAVLATALAGLGLYGLLAYSVSQRTREIAVRVALGATATRVRGLVLRQVTAIALVGTVIGVAATWLLSRLVSGLLFGVGAVDPAALAGAAVILSTVCLGAAYVPARRASRLDPTTALRYE